MKLKLVVLSIFMPLFCLSQDLAADVLLFHGSHAKNEDWYQPSDDPKKGLFFKELSLQASRLGLGKVIPCRWSGMSGLPGKASVREHIKAAEAFAVGIRAGFAQDRPHNVTRLEGPLHIVGHSNGAILAIILSHLLCNPHSPEFSGKALYPLFEESKNAVLTDKKIDKNIHQCRQWFLSAAERARKSFDPNDRMQIKIAQLIMIAAPISRSFYPVVNMRVVDKVCSLFSSGDGVQKFAGNPRYPKGPNVLNFRVSMRSPSGGVLHPMHTQMHHHAIARYLLNLMSDVVDQKNIQPSAFGSIGCVDVLFQQFTDDLQEQPPLFEITQNLKKHPFPASGF